MSGLLDELDEQQDHEITLGTGALLAIFFAVVLICAVFFGLGYSLGRRSGEPATAGLKTSSPAAKSAATNSSASTPSEEDSPDTSSAKTSAASPSKSVTRTNPKIASPQTDAEAAPAVEPKPGPAKAATVSSTSPVSAPASTSQTMVQLMAAAQSEDAEILATALRKRGYHAVVRNEPDHLFHVQVGPFASRTEADTMRRKLQADGYNAILK